MKKRRSESFRSKSKERVGDKISRSASAPKRIQKADFNIHDYSIKKGRVVMKTNLTRNMRLGRSLSP